jgi:hypothetical protein
MQPASFGHPRLKVGSQSKPEIQLTARDIAVGPSGAFVPAYCPATTVSHFAVHPSALRLLPSDHSRRWLTGFEALLTTLTPPGHPAL